MAKRDLDMSQHLTLDTPTSNQEGTLRLARPSTYMHSSKKLDSRVDRRESRIGKVGPLTRSRPRRELIIQPNWYDDPDPKMEPVSQDYHCPRERCVSCVSCDDSPAIHSRLGVRRQCLLCPGSCTSYHSPPIHFP